MANDTDGTDSNDVLHRVSSVLGDVVTGIPTPALKRMGHVFARLWSAAIEVPASALEGKVEERRAIIRGRIAVVDALASQIATEVEADPRVVAAASAHYSRQLIDAQKNLDSVARIAANSIQDKFQAGGFKSEQPSCELNAGCQQGGAATDEQSFNDWLSVFQKEASLKSREEIQEMFGRILAGELARPSSFSIRTLKLVGELSQGVAAKFLELCSLSIAYESETKVLDCRIPSLEGNAAFNALLKYGFSFDTLNLLEEHGLIISDYNSWYKYGPSVLVPEQACLPFSYAGKFWGLSPRPDFDGSNDIAIHGIKLTRAGVELRSVLDIVPCPEYSAALQKFFSARHLSMIEVPKPTWPSSTSSQASQTRTPTSNDSIAPSAKRCSTSTCSPASTMSARPRTGG